METEPLLAIQRKVLAEELGSKVVIYGIGAACAVFLCWSCFQARLHARREYLARVAAAGALARAVAGFQSCEEAALADPSLWTYSEEDDTEQAWRLSATPEESERLWVASGAFQGKEPVLQ